jgi:hypothetical protein
MKNIRLRFYAITITLCIFTLAAIVGISGCDKTDDAIDEVVDSYLKEFYASDKGLTIEFEGDQATIADFGTSYLGSDRSIIDIGDVYIKNITRTGPNKWSANIIEGTYNLSSLKSITYASTTITLDGTKLSFSNPDKWDITWNKTTKPTTGTGGTGTSTTTPTTGDTIYNQVIEGDMYDKKIVRFTIPSGIKTLTVYTCELGSGEKNSADMFVSKGTDPTVTSSSPYTYTAQCASIKPNRERELCVFSNPGSGQWSVLLYGYNTYFFSRLVVVTTK